MGQAEVLLLEAQKVIPENESVLAGLVRLCINLKQLEKPLDCLEGLTALKPENIEHYLHVPLLSERLGLFDKGIEAYKQLLRRKPGLFSSHGALDGAARQAPPGRSLPRGLERQLGGVLHLFEGKG